MQRRIAHLVLKSIGNRVLLKTSISTLLAFLVAVTSLLTVVAQAQEAIPGEYLVKYKDRKFSSMVTFSSTPYMNVVDHNPRGRILKVKLDPVGEARALSQIMRNANVEYVVPNIRIHALLSRSQPQQMQPQAPATNLQAQWAIKKIHAEEAWARAGNKGSRKVLVAVIDTGVDSTHEALKDNMIPGYDFFDNTADPDDRTSKNNPGHGTHCAGIIGATGLISGGTVGISPDVSIMPLRFLGPDGSGDLNNGIKAIDYAIQKGANVISASWGATVHRANALPLVDAVKRADDAGIIFVVAAANDGSDNDVTEVYPANSGFPNTIVVAASGPQDEMPDWTNYGTKTVHLAAPGVDILSTLPKNTYDKLSGTSMATPLVSGLVAFLKAQDPSLTGAQARALLQTTAVPTKIKTACNCRVDALAAVDALLSKKMFVTPAAGSLTVGDVQKFTATFGQEPLTFVSSNQSAATIAADGTLTAVAAGDTQITIRDARGQSAKSLAIHVVPPPPPRPPGADLCPYDNPELCDISCQYDPSEPWCN